MKIKLAAVALVMSAAFCCSDTQATDLLGRMLNRGGDCCAPTCCDTPAPTCCNRGFGFSLHLNFGINGGLFNRGCGGCGPVANDCGGCGNGCGILANRGGGLLAGLFQGGCGNECGGCDTGYVDNCCGNHFGRFNLFSRGCGCQAEASCGDTCGDSCCGGLLSNLRGRLAGLGSRGCCDTGCNNDCGGNCEAGCAGPGLLAHLRGRVGGLRGRLGGCCDTGCEAPAKDCGGCDPCARPGIRGRLAAINLRGRLASLGGCCDNGCENSGCGCNGGEATPAEAAPQEAQEPTKAAEGSTSISPTVDPSAFIIRGGRFVRN